jgi:hypothetical protein
MVLRILGLNSIVGILPSSGHLHARSLPVIRSELPGSVLRGVTQTIRKIGLTSAKPENDSSPDFLVVMNVPALIGMRDAAYLRAIELFRKPLFSLPETERIRLYEGMSTCLGNALTAGERAIPGSSLPDPLPLLESIRYLDSAVQAILLLLREEHQLFEREKALTLWFGSDFSTTLRNAEDVVNNVEVNLYHSLQEFIDLGEAPFLRLRELTRNAFSKNEVERYDKALGEFQTLYRAKTRIGDREESANHGSRRA